MTCRKAEDIARAQRIGGWHLGRGSLGDQRCVGCAPEQRSLEGGGGKQNGALSFHFFWAYQWVWVRLLKKNAAPPGSNELLKSCPRDSRTHSSTLPRSLFHCNFSAVAGRVGPIVWGRERLGSQIVVRSTSASRQHSGDLACKATLRRHLCGAANGRATRNTHTRPQLHPGLTKHSTATS
jgi:hypothetical protein